MNIPLDLNAFFDYTECMKSSHLKQYTIRNLPPQLDEALRKKARQSGLSLNEVALEALHRGSGLSKETVFYHDLDSLIGTWKEDPEFEKALEDQDQIDSHLWS